MLAASYNSLGSFAEARSHAEQALYFYDPVQHSSLAWRYIHDLGVAAMCHRANALWHLGFPDQAIAIEREALAWAEKLNHHNTTGYALFYAGALPAFRRRDGVVLDCYAHQLVAHGEQHKLPQWVIWGTYLQGPALTAAGRAKEAITRIENALETAEHMQNRAFRPMVYGILAEAKFACGDSGSAIQLIDAALSLAECTGERWMNPELLRTKGSILLSGLHKEEAADACFRRSIELAQQQGSKMFELRSGLSLARFWRNIGKTTEARDLIFSIYNGLSEGFGTFELKEAEIWLRDLEQR